MRVEAVNERTRRYIERNFLYARPGFSLGDEMDLFRSGILDSMGVMELIEFIEEEFGVSIGEDDITEENLGSIAAIGDYVSRRASAEASPRSVAP